MKKSNAFTLIELVVVILIINLLLAVSIPALNQAGEQARCAACAGNLKALGVANSTYAADHNDWYLPVLYSNEYWGDILWPANETFKTYLQIDSYRSDSEDWYYDVPDEFICPSDKISNHIQNRLSGVLLSYGYNCTDWRIYNSSGSRNKNVSYVGYRADQIKHPSALLAFTDGIDWWLQWSGADYRRGWDLFGQANIKFYRNRNVFAPTIYRHSEGANVLFYDGHVDWMPKQDIFVVEEWDANPQIPGIWSNYDTYPPPP